MHLPLHPGPAVSGPKSKGGSSFEVCFELHQLWCFGLQIGNFSPQWVLAVPSLSVDAGLILSCYISTALDSSGSFAQDVTN
jgi:hypothetical protein